MTWPAPVQLAQVQLAPGQLVPLVRRPTPRVPPVQPRAVRARARPWPGARPSPGAPGKRYGRSRGALEWGCPRVCRPAHRCRLAGVPGCPPPAGARRPGGGGIGRVEAGACPREGGALAARGWPAAAAGATSPGAVRALAVDREWADREWADREGVALRRKRRRLEAGRRLYRSGPLPARPV